MFWPMVRAPTGQRAACALIRQLWVCVLRESGSRRAE